MTIQCDQHRRNANAAYGAAISKRNEQRRLNAEEFHRRADEAISSKLAPQGVSTSQLIDAVIVMGPDMTIGQHQAARARMMTRLTDHVLDPAQMPHRH